MLSVCVVGWMDHAVIRCKCNGVYSTTVATTGIYPGGTSIGMKILILRRVEDPPQNETPSHRDEDPGANSTPPQRRMPWSSVASAALPTAALGGRRPLKPEPGAEEARLERGASAGGAWPVIDLHRVGAPAALPLHPRGRRPDRKEVRCAAGAE